MIVLHCRKPRFLSLPVSPPIYRSKSAKFQLCITARRRIIFGWTAPGHICSLFFSFSKSGRRNNAKTAKKQTPETPLILVFLNENCCLCICFTELFFFLLIISSLSCNFNRCADCFQSFSKQLFPEYSKCRALNHFKIKNKHDKFFIMLERYSVNAHSNSRHSSHYKSENRLAV